MAGGACGSNPYHNGDIDEDMDLSAGSVGGACGSEPYHNGGIKEDMHESLEMAGGGKSIMSHVKNI